MHQYYFLSLKSQPHNYNNNGQFSYIILTKKHKETSPNLPHLEEQNLLLLIIEFSQQFWINEQISQYLFKHSGR